MKNKIYFIAEANVNNNRSLNKALKLVDIASKSRADYIKFQVVKADNINKSAKKSKISKK